MTVGRLQPHMNGQPSIKQTSTSRKTVLFCHGCEYSAPPDGSWVVHHKPDCDVYLCPNCTATVTVRERFD